MKKLILAAALIAGSAAAASAADLRMPTKAPAMAPVYSWTGFYIGAHAGYSWINSDSATTHLPSQVAFNAAAFGQSTDGDGFIGGVQAGYNWQSGSLVFGVEADISYTSISGSSRLAPLAAFGGAVIPAAFQTVTTDLDWFGTARLRAGMTLTPQLLLYVTGGLAFGDVEQTVLTTYSPGLATVTFPGSSSETRTGWTIGGGAEWALARNWTVKAEYLYYDLGDVTILAGPAAPNPPFAVVSTHDLTGHIARLGVNYRF